MSGYRLELYSTEHGITYMDVCVDSDEELARFIMGKLNDSGYTYMSRKKINGIGNDPITFNKNGGNRNES